MSRDWKICHLDLQMDSVPPTQIREHLHVITMSMMQVLVVITIRKSIVMNLMVMNGQELVILLTIMPLVVLLNLEKAQSLLVVLHLQ